MRQVLLFLLFSLVLFVRKGECIQCYKCESINGNDIGCEMGRRDQPYSNPCYVGVNSYVKGNRCIKIVGTSAYDHTSQVVIRDCTDRTHDKEGMISFNNHLINGRTHTCKSNLCNGASRMLNAHDLLKFISFVCVTVFTAHKYSRISS